MPGQLPARVLEVLQARKGPIGPGKLARELDAGLSEVSRTLMDLRGRGLARRVRRGAWEVVR
jgi:DNA-binding IclR family transcriptional regulator